MAQSRTISGSAGTLPQGLATDDLSAAATAAAARGPVIAARVGDLAPRAPARRDRERSVPPGLALRRRQLADAIDTARNYRAVLMKLPHVLDVRAGYKFKDGRITETPAVVVVVDRKVDGLPPAEAVPFVVGGLPTDVTPADPFERLRAASSGAEVA